MLKLCAIALLALSVNADPCGVAAYPIGSIFYNSTSNYMCFCGASDVDLKMDDNTTACF